jgi:hypothetical protein
MHIPKPSSDTIKKLFTEYNSTPYPRDQAFKTIEIVNFFHNYYMEKIEVILAIAGEMQKHFKEPK